MRAQRLWCSILGMIGVSGIVLGLNMFAGARLATRQIDLTADHLYTLSSGTRTVLRGLRAPVTLSLYYSPALGLKAPSYGVYAAHVRQMLRQYAALSGGRVEVRFYDPRPFSRIEDRAIADGLSGVPIDRSGTRVYFGVVATNLLDQHKAIPFLDPAREAFLEYDLTLLVDQISGAHRPVVGVMSALPLAGDFRAMMMAHGQGNAGRPWLIWRELSRNFATRLIPTTVQEIPRAVRVLLVVQPQSLSLATTYAIDQFVMRGGRLMVMVDPRSEAEARMAGPQGRPPPVTGSTLAPLLGDWGIAYDPAKVVAQVSGALRVAGNGTSPLSGVRFIPWFTLHRGIAHNDPALAGLAQVTVASAGFLAKKKGAAITFTPLLTSGAHSEVLALSAVTTHPDPARLLARFRPAGGGRVIAARVRGMLHSAFPGPPPLPKGQTRPAHFPPYLAATKQPADLVVVADSDILDNAVLRLPLSENAAFVVNLVGSLAGGDPLLGLRARGVVARPFLVVARMRRAAELRFRRTELALEAHLKATETRLAALRTGPGANSGTNAALLTPAQQAAIGGLRRDVIATHQKLRRVQYDLGRSIAGLEMELRLFNIAVVPAGLTLIALLIALARRGRRRAARRHRPMLA